ncbi:N-acyl homoserine lactonase family protein [Petroclostridium sp. X23]|uniref:N-acyl homoserine lactonase family protein n=1 Tax=Petroclostridium sp. X23 TaxID=3045146 RepID=UPI0024ADA55B|nr:N-acyl homoserine lactonase family protein [Petroclostridium sp. X23]WHH57276.1 N-acyl homoserine lactonase family protein [Petroclostridium sp. X23]
MKNLKLYVLDLGRMRMDQNLIVSQSIIADSVNPNKVTQHTEFPVQAFLIESSEGYVLYDTGCNPASMGPNGRWPLEFQQKVPYYGNEECSTLNRLKQLGVAPDDIKWVILSHMHNDHAGCVEYFPKSKFIVHKDEFDAAVHAYATHDYMSSYIWHDIDAWTRQKMDWNFITNSDGDISLLPGLTILNLGSGHARGVLGLHIELQNTGGVIITSDAIYSSDNFGEPLREPGVVYDTVGWRAAAKRIKSLVSQTNSRVWFGHDAKQFEGLKKSTEGYYD